ncbi:KGGVGR-motif variant AAA ATPase [Pedobacter aquatilis]|uniref:KGGVGR-motif variant AAA ATPase n=1 Tax=Pedobacter aquatilis TaxID=351343 RepID=UPI002930B4AE|nr:tetratricopeptide repeat protein [Pedobacter aquatilis]
MKTITFYSYKGGVGRSLALANVANRLSEFGKKVCIIDFDLEAPGLHLKFAQHIKKRKVNKGIVDYISEFTEHKKVPSKIKDFVTQVQFDDIGRQDISLIGAGDTTSRAYWRKLSCLDWKQLFYEQDSVGVEFFSNLKQQIRKQLAPDVLLIDSRTGITDIAGLTMSIFADEVVLLAANNRENLEGIAEVIKTLSDPRNSLSQRTPKMHFVLSRIPYFSNAKDKPKEVNAKHMALRTVNQQLEKEMQLDKVMVIHSDPDLEYEEKFKISYKGEFSTEQSSSPIGLDYLELFESLTQDIISEKDKRNFYDFIHIESLIEKAFNQTDLPNRIRILKTALQLNPLSANAIYYLGMAYLELNDLHQGIDYLNKVLELRPAPDDNTKIALAHAYIRLQQVPQALKMLEEYLKQFPTSMEAVGLLSHTKYLMKDFDASIRGWRQATVLAPESSEAFNGLGNVLRASGDYEAAYEALFRALEIDPQDPIANGSLAELYAAMGNDREFFKNLELSFSLGMDKENFQRILEEERIYKKYYLEPKFLGLLDKYQIEIDWPAVHRSIYLEEN